MRASGEEEGKPSFTARDLSAAAAVLDGYGAAGWAFRSRRPIADSAPEEQSDRRRNRLMRLVQTASEPTAGGDACLAAGAAVSALLE
jgi:hypothetical protein